MFAELIVLELASVLAGPSVGQFFAELGAAVIKVENVRTRGDVTRRWRLPSEPPEAGVSSYFACCNWGKRSIALDLKTDDGRRLLHDLTRRADVVLASYKPGDAEKLGADAATLCALNPRLLYGHLTGYGGDDPRAGYDAVIQAESGFTYMNGASAGPPVKMPVALTDVLAAHQLKEGLLLALLRRERTGKGGVVRVSLLQAAASALANQATNWLTAGEVPQRLGSDHPNIAPYGTVYHTSDDLAVVLAVGTDRQFAALCDVLRLPELPGDARFTTNAARVRHREDLQAHLQRALGAWRRDDLLERLHAAHVPAGAVNDLREVFTLSQASALVLRADGGKPAAVRQTAFTLDDALPPASLPPPPAYGADTIAILSETGLTQQAIAGLARAGIIHAPTLSDTLA